ncbi:MULTISPECIES: hypothetical protein [Streptomyces]|uniref:Regulatory protein n=1 Tax=Streptomyces thermoviolaceus subsp. thermoviolaceus TaxID=66860 RepID=A0ABX0YZ78_STRTL|nr:MULTISPECIES: hypothetical protein [Streptomyces]MCM3266803.1 hypothetical protein [Streptomyces thermoviolaceus]NJP16295.1 hypothetical protein [Streptomyces thermoviolaceus subsp. thermoviolaceus]RSS08157.1 hypothetical protein EF917_02620 [Streptomyces sp. WAC00469]WTD50561.1 hypothetical protein OG899_25410 [Streptomyces thermoviolaceus]GGV82468.1 hypothetical protein GCM10010499_48240 [Streptomyces thermoviolaceus subsp. apingens]
MPIESTDATLRSRYAEQAAADLEQNRRQQEELARRLETLRQEETLLRNILDIAERPGATPAQAHVPHQAQGEPVAPSAAPAPAPAEKPAEAEDGAVAASAEDGETQQDTVPAQSTGEQAAEESAPKAAKKPAPKAARKTAKKTGPQKGTQKGARKAAAKSASKGRGKNGRQVLLRDLLLELLSGHSEPRLAAELREELLSKHPDREPSPQVVRNTLESLVAKGRIQRYKQNRSVMYTVVEGTNAQAQAAAEAGSAGAA